MANMGLVKLALANPRCNPLDETAITRASGADHILRDAQIFPDLATAITNDQLVYAFTARRRGMSHQILDVRTACVDAVTQISNGVRLAFVFGPENTGLSNRETDLCDHLVEIPSENLHASLNLAAAVQVASYELRMSTSGTNPVINSTRELASKFEHQQLLAQLEQIVKQECPPRHSGLRNRMLKRMALLLARAKPDKADLRMLRGMLKLVTKLSKN